jgi:hypothetical protein
MVQIPKWKFRDLIALAESAKYMGSNWMMKRSSTVSLALPARW